MATRDEQETTVTYNRGDNTVRVWTSYPPHVRKFRKDDRAKEVAGTPVDQTEDMWAEFEISGDDFNVTGGFKRRMTEEQRQAMSERARERFGK